jgi:hypothetical protein
MDKQKLMATTTVCLHNFIRDYHFKDKDFA